MGRPVVERDITEGLVRADLPAMRHSDKTAIKRATKLHMKIIHLLNPRHLPNECGGNLQELTWI